MAGMKIRWWDWLPFQPWRIVQIVDDADDVAQQLPRNGISLVGRPGAYKWVVFDCPCRTGHRILLNLDPGRRPYWQIDAASRRRLTIRPSVDYSDATKRCHYFVRKGNILWARSRIG